MSSLGPEMAEFGRYPVQRVPLARPAMQSLIDAVLRQRQTANAHYIIVDGLTENGVLANKLAT